MAYIKRGKYTVIDDDVIKSEMLDVLIEKGIADNKARQLVFYPVPMSLIRWSKYLEPSEIKLFLEPFKEENATDEETEDFGF